MFFFIPSNENGVIIDPYAAANLRDIASDVEEIFIFSHGWWTSAIDAMISYNRFAAGLHGAMQFAMGDLAMAIHWPSMLSENSRDWLNLAEGISFFTMEQRAEHVGRHGVCDLLRWILEQRITKPRRVHLLGHSFGCKVLCAALAELMAKVTPAIWAPAAFNLVMLQAAIEDDALSPSGRYGGLSQIPSLRILITRSSQDTALGVHFKRAHAVEFCDHEDRRALGAVGPDATTVASLGGAANLMLGSPGSPSGASNAGRLLVADLSEIHRQRVAQGLYKPAEFAGQHSDIYFAEIYELIAGFICPRGTARPSSPQARVPLPVAV